MAVLPRLTGFAFLPLFFWLSLLSFFLVDRRVVLNIFQKFLVARYVRQASLQLLCLLFAVCRRDSQCCGSHMRSYPRVIQ